MKGDSETIRWPAVQRWGPALALVATLAATAGVTVYKLDTQTHAIEILYAKVEAMSLGASATAERIAGYERRLEKLEHASDLCSTQRSNDRVYMRTLGSRVEMLVEAIGAKLGPPPKEPKNE